MTLTLYISDKPFRSWELDFTGLTAKGYEIYLKGKIWRAKRQCKAVIGKHPYEFCIGPVMSKFPPVEEEKPRKKYVRDGVPFIQAQKPRNREAIRKGYGIAV